MSNNSKWKQPKWKQRMKKTGLCLLGSLQIAALSTPLQALASDPAGTASTVQVKRQMEFLDRGVVAVKTSEGVFVSWRLLGTDPASVSFHLYRDGNKITSSPITGATNYVDAEGTGGSTYTVRAIVDGKELAASKPSDVLAEAYLDVPLRKPADGVNPDGSVYTYNANDASVGDVDGDGQYEIILKWDPSNAKDNSQSGITGEVFVDAYKLDGTQLWRISLGRNIRAGAHYTQFMVYDLDGDGKAEVAMKTADGTRDGKGTVIGDPNADYRNANGYVLSGPEFLTIFNGATGEAMATLPYTPPRGSVSSWGDNYGNRVDRFLATIAYLDGERPSLVMARGYYTRAVLAAYNFRDGQLTPVWTFDTDSDPSLSGYRGQGNHNLSVADVDNDGKDEIIYGAAAIDHDGKGLYTTGLGHGDAMHLGDLDPTRPGLEVFQVHESRSAKYGLEFRDADTGEAIWGVYTGIDTGRGMSADIDPRYPGEEVWASGGKGLFTAQGQHIGSAIPSSINFGIWWDGDLQREILDHNWNGSSGVGKIDKWDYINQKTINVLTAEDTLSNNHTKGNPSLQADIFGDWREEAIWRKTDSSALRIFTTTAVTKHRIPTLMHDPVYRIGAAWQNVAYNQPPHTSFYLGEGMATPPAASMYVTYPADVKLTPGSLNVKSNGGDNSVTAQISLPAYTTSAIDATSVTLSVYGGGKLQATEAQGQQLKFDRKQLIDAVNGQSGSVEVTVTGRLQDGNRFTGSAQIKVQ